MRHNLLNCYFYWCHHCFWWRRGRVELSLKHDISLIGLPDMIQCVPFTKHSFPPFYEIIAGIVLGGHVTNSPWNNALLCVMKGQISLQRLHRFPPACPQCFADFFPLFLKLLFSYLRSFFHLQPIRQGLSRPAGRHTLGRTLTQTSKIY